MQNKNMKKLIVILVLGALNVCLVPAVAQVQDWEVSTMQGSGSAYSSQITPVGASSVEGNIPNEDTGNTSFHGTIRRGFEPNEDTGSGDPGSPVGDAVFPLLLMATMAGGFICYRRRKQVVVE